MNPPQNLQPPSTMAEVTETVYWREIRRTMVAEEEATTICVVTRLNGQRPFGGHEGGGGYGWWTGAGGGYGGGVRYVDGRYQPKFEGTLSNIANFDWLRPTELDIVPPFSQFQIGPYVYDRSFANDLVFSWTVTTISFIKISWLQIQTFCRSFCCCCYNLFCDNLRILYTISPWSYKGSRWWLSAQTAFHLWVISFLSCDL